MRRMILTMLVAACLAAPVMGSFGGLVYHEVQITDELRRDATNVTSVTVRTSGTTDAATIFADPQRLLTITQPMTSGSTNTTLDTSNGTFFWYGDGPWDYTISDGTTPQTNNGRLTMSASDSLIIYPTYLQAISSTTLTDAQTQTYGTDSDWVANGGATADRMTFIPATADTAEFWIGNTNFPANLELFGATSGWNAKWDASENSWIFLDNAIFAVGTGSDYTISHNGSTTTITGAYSTSGVRTFETDVVFDGATDIKYDDSRAQLHFQDNSVLGIGGAADAAGDVTFTHDGSDFLLDAAIADEGWLIGTTSTGFDIAYRFETAGEFITDYDDDFIGLTDDMDFRWGTGASADGDFMMSSTSGNLLTLDVVAAGVGEFAIGNDADDVPFKWFGETAGDFAYFTGDQLQLEDIDLSLGDSTLLLFGDALGTGDIKIYATSTDLIIDGVVAETGTVAIGVTDLGIDFKLWAATSAEGILWDASDEDLKFTGVNIVLDSSSAIENSVVTIADTDPYTILAASSGKTHVIPAMGQDGDIDFPAEAAGLYYRFIYGGAADEANDFIFDTGSNTNYFIGGVAFNDTDAGNGADEVHAGVYSNGSTNSKFTLNNISIGTIIEFHCNGTQWNVSGIVFSDTVPSFGDQ